MGWREFAHTQRTENSNQSDEIILSFQNADSFSFELSGRKMLVLKNQLLVEKSQSHLAD